MLEMQPKDSLHQPVNQALPDLRATALTPDSRVVGVRPWYGNKREPHFDYGIWAFGVRYSHLLLPTGELTNRGCCSRV